MAGVAVVTTGVTTCGVTGHVAAGVIAACVAAHVVPGVIGWAGSRDFLAVTRRHGFTWPRDGFRPRHPIGFKPDRGMLVVVHPNP